MTDETAPIPEPVPAPEPEPEPEPEPQDPRSVITRILDKVHELLLGEPARLIGYGAAVVVVLVAQALSYMGYARFDDIDFDKALPLVGAVILLLITVIESIRRFVYSPLTYIEDLADEWQAGHEEAHLEERMNNLFREIVSQQAQTTVLRVAHPAPEGKPN